MSLKSAASGLATELRRGRFEPLRHAEQLFSECEAERKSKIFFLDHLLKTLSGNKSLLRMLASRAMTFAGLASCSARRWLTISARDRVHARRRSSGSLDSHETFHLAHSSQVQLERRASSISDLDTSFLKRSEIWKNVSLFSRCSVLILAIMSSRASGFHLRMDPGPASLPWARVNKYSAMTPKSHSSGTGPASLSRWMAMSLGLAQALSVFQ
mmetsp:Transcript_7097/g.20019  ORF Transcript_7097/g.20019 Transcript_7097/m.20019 type:complete len:213 (+) Transcript_7097:385-1023(+)